MISTEALGRRLWHVRRKLACNFLPLALAATCFMLIIGKMQVEDAIVNWRTAEVSAVATGASTVARGIDYMPRDILFLYLLDDVSSLVSTPSAAALKRIERIFIAFLNASGVYSQARWIDAEGHERLRVDHTDDKTWRVSGGSLQDKSRRYYFIETMKLPRNGIYISPMDLNIEQNKIVVPFEPTLRVATPIFDLANHRQGILILNRNMSPNLKLLTKFSENHAITLIDERGYWLKGERPEDEWGNSLSHPEISLAVRYPESWQRLLGRKSGQFEDGNGLWTFRRVEPMPEKLQVSGENNLQFPVLTVVSRVPAEQLASLRRDMAVPSMVLLMVVLVALFFVSASEALASQVQVEARAMIKSKADELARTNARLENAYAALRMTQDELIRSEKLSALGLMVAGVAHEINTPLGAALVAASKTQEAGAELERKFEQGLRRSDLELYFKLQRDGFQLTLRNLERAARLIKSFKQLAADRASEDKRLFNLAEIVKECLVLFENPAKHSRVTFKVDIASDLELDSYPGPLSQVLHNLINNALTHAFEGRHDGRICISAHSGEQPDFIRIEVEDNGNGMNRETLNRIFDPFFTTQRGRGGMGLGLHLSHQIAELVLGGSLDVKSSPDKGTRFLLRVPVRAPEPEPVPPDTTKTKV